MNPAKILLAILVVAMVGVGVFFLLQTTPQPIVDPTREPAAAQPLDPEKPEMQRATIQKPPPPTSVQRTAVPVANNNANAAQGVRGVVVDPAGGPVAEAQVYLMEGQGANVFETLIKMQRGQVFPPVARAVTDAGGQFQLGLEQALPDKTFEVRVLSPRFMDARVPNLSVRAAEWVELPPIKMQQGAMVHGRITVAGSSMLPIAGAEVSVKQAGGFGELAPPPGRENGIVATTDGSGSFRLENVPPGAVNIAAVAQGFARVERQGVNIDGAAQNEVNLELPTGLSISGMVVDATGAPISHAKLTAVAISSKTPSMVEGRSGQAGQFEILGLVEGPYTLSGIAQGFVKGNAGGPVQAGSRDVQLVLEKQGGARVRVFGKNGQLLNTYTLTLKSWFKAQDTFGNVTEISPLHVRSPRDGIATMEGLNPGEYVFQVEAPAHAKGFSPPFTITAGAEQPLVEVHLNEGGTLEGRVLGDEGQPLAGVNVETLPNDLDDNPFTKMFGGLIPYKITRTSARTDAEGRFRITLLNAGTYQLKLTHPEHFEVFLKDNEVVVGQPTLVPDVRMSHGCVLSGRVIADGQPAGQVKVTANTQQDAVVQPALGGPTAAIKPPATFHCEAITDNDGNFVLGKRLPPGRYEVRAMRQTLANPLEAILDMQRSRQEILVQPGQTSQSVTIQFTVN